MNYGWCQEVRSFMDNSADTGPQSLNILRLMDGGGRAGVRKRERERERERERGSDWGEKGERGEGEREERDAIERKKNKVRKG